MPRVARAAVSTAPAPARKPAPKKKGPPPDSFPSLLTSVKSQFARVNHLPLFSTNVTDLYEVFIDYLPAKMRPVYDCRACRDFVNTYGTLVAINLGGTLEPAMWPANDVPKEFADAVSAVRAKVQRARVTGLFLSPEGLWGKPLTGVWSHFNVLPSDRHIYRGTTLKNAGQVMAEKREEFGMLQRALEEFPLGIAMSAVNILRSGNLYRGEKTLGVAEWFLALQTTLRDNVNRSKIRRENLVWRAVAEAPAGWCHIRSTMIGTLLEDLAAGKPFDAVKRAFDQKMNPLQYLRPQALPKTGNLVRAERVVAELDAANALDRRFAMLDEVKTVWRAPLFQAPPRPRLDGGVFSHLLPPSVLSPARRAGFVPKATMTFAKFARTILPGARHIEYLVPFTGPFIALTTAADPAAPRIIRWDREDWRNPFSWYVYTGGSPASRWNLRSATWTRVTGISLLPSMWHSGEADSPGAVAFLDGAVDTGSPSACIFPEHLRSEFHEIRASIEAYSRSAKLHGAASASACGIDLRAYPQTLRVTTDAGVTDYKIDRWD